MKNITTLVFLLISVASFAKEGYRIQLKLTDKKDSMVYLAHYFGKNFPTIYKSDSAKLDKNGNAVFEMKEKIVGGIYIVLPSDRNSYFEFLLNDGDNVSITATMNDLPGSIKFKNSPVNEDFLKYQMFLIEYGKKQKSLQAELESAKTNKDTATVYSKMKEAGKEFTGYRRSYVKENPNTLLASIFNALEIPEVPEGKHYLPDGKEDSFFAYHYYRNHYWDGFNFKDDRLIHTPILERKLDEYFNKIVPQQEDSVIIAADTILSKMRGSENLFKFTLNWLSTNAQRTKVMGMDKVFVHLVEHYYMKGDAFWLGSEELSKYIDRAKDIAPNVINNPAPPFKAVDADGKEQSLYDFKAKYTLLIFYSPDCGHCITEVPKVDSVYRAVLKDKGVRVFAFNIDREELKWREFITKHNLYDWLHVWDPNVKSRYWALYDVKATPSIYLLDEDKVIRGKKLDHSTIAKALEITEMREKMGKK